MYSFSTLLHLGDFIGLNFFLSEINISYTLDGVCDAVVSSWLTPTASST